MKLGLFDLTVHLTDDAFELEVFAGQDRDQVQSAQDRFRIVQAMRSDITREILLKLERALAGNQTAIDVNVQGSRAIVRDPTFVLPPPTPTPAAVAAAPATLTASAVKPPAATMEIDSRAVAMAAPPSRRMPKAGRPRAGAAKVSKQPVAVAKGGRGRSTTPQSNQPRPKKSKAKASSKASSAKRKPKPKTGGV